MKSKKEEVGMAFQAQVSGMRTDVAGGFKITLHVFECESEIAQRLLMLTSKNVQVAVIPLPE